MLLGIVQFVLVLFAGTCLLLYLLQGKMIFYPQPTAPGIQARYAEHEIRLQHGDTTLTGWFFKGRIDADQPLIVYYGGNAEDVSLNFSDMDRFPVQSFVFMNYRGYGQSQGRPSEKALLADAVFILDHLIETEAIAPAHVVLMGRSLGSGVAVHVAAQRAVGGLILVTPFDSLVNVARAHYPIFPVGWLLRHRFDSASLAPDIAAPALFLTASHDQIVSPRLAANLQRVWGGPVTAVRVDGTDHNSIQASSTYWEAIHAFLSTGSGLQPGTADSQP